MYAEPNTSNIYTGSKSSRNLHSYQNRTEPIVCIPNSVNCQRLFHNLIFKIYISLVINFSQENKLQKNTEDARK